MHPLITFLAASSLALMDLAVLAWLTSRLGAGPSGRQRVLLGLAVLLKLGVLVAGAAWLSSREWVDRRSMMMGLLAPFALFLAWQVLRLQIRAGRRA